jgi:hypothetical protein
MIPWPPDDCCGTSDRDQFHFTAVRARETAPLRENTEMDVHQTALPLYLLHVAVPARMRNRVRTHHH